MSVLDDIQTMETRIASRLNELQPLVDEYQELISVAKKLGFDITIGAKPVPKPKAAAKTKPRAAAKARPAAKPKPAAGAEPVAVAKPAAKTKAPARTRRSASGASAKRRPGGTRATGAQRRDRVLELIRERPGITVPDISKELGVEPPPLYRVVRKLVADGTIKKDGKSLALA